MIYNIFADTVVLIHFLWIVFLLFGAFLRKIHRHIKFLHIIGLAYALIIQIFDLYCPLTLFEFWLRRLSDPTLRYETSFISYYLEKLIYVEVSREVILILTFVIILLNFILYMRDKNSNLWKLF